MELEKISIREMLQEIKQLEQKYNVSLDSYRAEESKRGSFLSKFSHENADIDIKRLNLSSDDNKSLKNADTYADVKAILSKYVKNPKSQRLDQISVSLPIDIFDSEVEKIKKATGEKHFTAYDIRKKMPFPQIEKILIDKTSKFIPLNVSNYLYNYQEFRNISESIEIVTGLPANITGINHNESLDAYEFRIHQENPFLHIKAYKNGNIRLTFENPQAQQAYRMFLIDKELKYIDAMRK